MWISAGAIVAFTAAVFFSTKAIFVKLTYLYGADAISALALRMVMALPMLLVIAWYSTRQGARPLTRADWKAVFLLGFTGYYLSSLLDFLGLEYITASLERLILFLYPTIVALISWVLFKKSIGTKGILALVLSYVGIAISFVRDLQHTGDVSTVLIGGGFVFACTVTYAIYIVGSGEMVGRIGALRFAAYATVRGGPVLPHPVCVDPPALHRLRLPAAGLWLRLRHGGDRDRAAGDPDRQGDPDDRRAQGRDHRRGRPDRDHRAGLVAAGRADRLGADRRRRAGDERRAADQREAEGQAGGRPGRLSGRTCEELIRAAARSAARRSTRALPKFLTD